VPSLEDIESRLAAYRPRLVDEVDGRQRAAVALILRRSERGAELLFIERALREGDPWSGHMAFPGGRLDPGDLSERDAAERETLEEVGLSLARSNYLGRLDDLEGRPALPAGGLVVSAHVYHIPDPDPLRPNHEVQQAFWFPLTDLQSSGRHVVYPHARYGGRELPGILVGVPDRHIVWGLTYRFLDVFLGAVGKPLPNRWADVHEDPAQEPPRS
jgi:8-oxo-dGTP pyrophosphatase MutT (NUDIX family)